MQLRLRLGLALAASIALLGWTALGLELRISLRGSFADGLNLIEALYAYLRFFTILANIFVAGLMSATCYAQLTGRPWPPTAAYNAALAYMLVTSVTYELLLRRLWTPQGLQLLTDATLHDIVPGLVLVFWIACAPRAGARWRDVLALSSLPVGYFFLTLAAGAAGAGYPYNFLNAAKLGYPTVGIVAVIFLSIFVALGFAATAVSRWRARERSYSADGCSADIGFRPPQ